MGSVLGLLSGKRLMKTLEFFIRNSDDSFSIKELRQLLNRDKVTIYQDTKELENLGFLKREKIKKTGKVMMVRLDKDAEQSILMMSLYRVLRESIRS